MKKYMLILIFLAACGRAEFGASNAGDDVVAPSESKSSADQANVEEEDRFGGNNANNQNDANNNQVDPAINARATTPGLDISVPYRALAQRNGNFVFSPHALDKSLLVLHAATLGETNAQFSDSLGISDTDTAYGAFAEHDENVQTFAPQFSSVGVWIDTVFGIDQFYVDQVDAFFGVTVRRVNLQETENARVQINNTVRDDTEGFVSETLPPTVLEMGDFVVAGGTYFDAPWIMPFHPDNAELATFGETDSTPREFMSKVGTFLSNEDDVLRAVALPLSNAHSVVLMMPKQDDISQFEQELNGDFIFRFIDDLALLDTKVVVPKIDVSTHLDLSEDGAEMGLDFLIQPDADFDGIGADAELGAFVQFSRLALNDNGAQTPPDANEDPAGLNDLRFDQPFVFAVVDLSNRSILYLGRIIE